MADCHQLISIIKNKRLGISIRRAAAALFGYLNYTCSIKELKDIRSQESDEVVKALLTWLLFWINRESSSEA